MVERKREVQYSTISKARDTRLKMEQADESWKQLTRQTLVLEGQAIEP